MTASEKLTTLALLSASAILIGVQLMRDVQAEAESEQARIMEQMTQQTRSEVMAWFEATWPCAGYGLADDGFQCVLRQRR